MLGDGSISGKADLSIWGLAGGGTEFLGNEAPTVR